MFYLTQAPLPRTDIILPIEVRFVHTNIVRANPLLTVILSEAKDPIISVGALHLTAVEDDGDNTVLRRHK